MDNTKRINYILYQLQSGDAVTRNNACDQALLLISRMTDKTEQNKLRQSIVLSLIDLGRGDDALSIIQTLRKSEDQNMRIVSYFDWIEYCKKIVHDTIEVEEAIRQCLAYTRELGVKEATVDAEMEMGKLLINKGEVREAINNFSDVSLYAESNHNRRLLSVSKYYIGYSLYRLGHLIMAENFIREATEIAYQEKSAYIAKQSEIMRAIVFMKQGQNNNASTIFRQWEDNFALSL